MMFPVPPKANPPDVSVVVVTHKHRRYVERCLDALERVRGEVSIEVFLVDNRSGDGTPELVAKKYPWVLLEARDKRSGFSANNNHALRRASGRYALVLNPDTEVRPGALAALTRFMDRNADVGVCGAKLLYPDGTVQPSCRRFPTVSSVLARRTPLRLFSVGSAANARHLMLDAPPEGPCEVDWLLGACLFVRRKAIDDVGLLDEGYFLYVEDIDWCYRMHQKGWRVCWVPEAEIVHHHLALSDRRLLSWHSWVHARSMIRYYRKHLAPSFLRLRSDS
jgi:N-acetylglucosaminyl-diphospho-decaprenol L-rhamnosyltransferase